MTRFVSPLLAVLFAMLLASCSASNMATMEQTGHGSKMVLHTNNSLLADRLSVDNIKSRKVGNLMEMQATLENDWKFELDFQYKIKWFDKDGFEIAPESQSWQQVVMPGRSQNNVQAVAPNPSAVRFEIWVRE